jgi:hypothetical protein
VLIVDSRSAAVWFAAMLAVLSPIIPEGVSEETIGIGAGYGVT